MNLQRKVKMIRCHYDPIIGPSAKNSHSFGEGPGQTRGEAEMTPVGVLIKLTLPNDQRWHIVPYSNIQSLEVFPDEAEVVQMPKRKPGA